MTKPWYTTVESIRGPLVVVEKTKNIGYGELCTVRQGSVDKLGQVLETTEDYAVVQLFEKSTGLDREAKVQFSGKPANITVDKSMLGRVFDGLGKPRDGKPISGDERDLNGAAINPASRISPSDFIETGVSSIDTMTTLVRGQKLPIFSAAGLPHNELAAQIIRQASIAKGDFVVIFAAMGVTAEEAAFFERDLTRTGAMDRTIMFLNLAQDPSVERVITPRAALTTAEYFAFELGYHVLVVLSDFTNYCEALREISAARSEVPGRRGYPGYLYTDLAAQYERAGMVHGAKGSITQIPILTMPAGDITHPVPDLTGYITEGQIVLESGLHRKGVTPPINPLPSLSRLMKSGIGKGKTRDDHSSVADSLYAAYAQALELRQLVAVVGDTGLTETDKAYLEFADAFEEEFLSQGFDNKRGILETLNLGWKLLSLLPKSELKKAKKAHVEKYIK